MDDALAILRLEADRMINIRKSLSDKYVKEGDFITVCGDLACDIQANEQAGTLLAQMVEKFDAMLKSQQP